MHLKSKSKSKSNTVNGTYITGLNKMFQTRTTTINKNKRKNKIKKTCDQCNALC